jgi:hypothetical protein
MNPIEKILTDKRLSLQELAVKMHVSYYQVWAALRGYPKFLPKGVVKGLANLGYNPDQIAQLALDYVHWRNSVVDERR